MYRLQYIVFEEHHEVHTTNLVPERTIVVWTLEISDRSEAILLAVEEIKKSLSERSECEYQLHINKDGGWQEIKLPEVQIVGYKKYLFGLVQVPVFEVR